MVGPPHATIDGPLGPCSVVDVAAAAEMLGGPDVEVWLREQGLVHQLWDGGLVIWGDVLEALRNIGKRPKQAVEPIRPGEIVSEDRAARALSWRRRDAVAWLRREGLSVVVDGRQVVVWDDVLDAVRRAGRRRPPRKRAVPTITPLATPGRILD
jgi:hypothetical protein